MGRWIKRVKRGCAVAGVGLAMLTRAALAEEQTTAFGYPLDGAVKVVDGAFQFVKYTRLQDPSDVAASQPFDTGAFQPLGGLADDSIGFGSGGGLGGLSADTPSLDAPGAGGVGPGESKIDAPNTLGDVLTNNIETVSAQQRSLVSIEPVIRGYRAGQIYTQADGAFWVPARQDLDTILGKIDPGLIQSVVVIPGPYSVQYGPGFSFIDVVTAPTPRYLNGIEGHNRMTWNYRANGEQIYGRDTVYGGDSCYGFRFSYGNRTGNDYDAGDGTDIPASYHNQDFLGQFGFDINPYQRVEVRYNRLDQTNTEYAGLFFDTDYLGTDACNVQLIDEDPSGPWSQLKLEGWYNRTRFHGDTRNQSKLDFHVIDRVQNALEAALSGNSTFGGTTQGNLYSTGGRGIVTFGETGDAQLTTGTDFRYVEQQIGEQFQDQLFDDSDPSTNDDILTNLPRAWSLDPGAFAAMTLPWSSYWTTNVGARLDFVRTDARASELRANTSLPGAGSNLTQDDVLYAFFLTNEIELSDVWSANVGFGHGQRPPTLTERYADGLFLGIIQSGFSRVIGDPDLNKERNWQIDASLHCDYDYFRATLTGFHAWILDYATFQVNPIADPAGARLLQYTSTDEATLSGFEANAECDLTTQLTAIGSLAYVDGRDQVIHAPLAGIFPLQARAGLRLHDADGGGRWGAEFGARIVDNQDRLGTFRIGTVGATSITETETPGFTTYYLRGYYNYSRNLSLVGGIDNLTDKTYLEHLDIRYPSAVTNGVFIPATKVLAPGITPYVGVEWTY